MLNHRWRLLFLAPLLATPYGALAAPHQDSQPITVRGGEETVPEWSQRIGHSLENRLIYPRPLGREDFSQGLVKVSFRCSEDGRPDGVALLSSSGAHELDRAAMRAVRGIKTLHPLPEGIGHDRRFEAWVAFAPDQEALQQMTNKLQSEAQRVNSAAVTYQTGTQVADASTAIVIAAN